MWVQTPRGSVNGRVLRLSQSRMCKDVMQGCSERTCYSACASTKNHHADYASPTAKSGSKLREVRKMNTSSFTVHIPHPVLVLLRGRCPVYRRRKVGSVEEMRCSGVRRDSFRGRGVGALRVSAARQGCRGTKCAPSASREIFFVGIGFGCARPSSALTCAPTSGAQRHFTTRTWVR